MLTDIGLLILRVGFGGLMLTHGLPKLLHFNDYLAKFADPIGLGVAPSLVLAVFAEVFCALAVMAGFATRAAAVPLVITMAVAAFIVHGNDPFARAELGILYGTAFLAIAFTGAGRFSADQFLKSLRLR